MSGPNISGNATTLTSTSSTVTSSIVKTPGTARYGVIAKDQRPNRPSTQKTTDVTVYSYLYNGTTYQNLKAQKDAPEGSVIYYYYNDTSVYIAKNACYEVYYSYGTGGDFVKGASKIFCLDNTAPAISYHVENAEMPSNEPGFFEGIWNWLTGN